MLKVNYEILNAKVENYDQLPIGDKYSLSNNIFNMLATADKKKVEEVLMDRGVKSLYERAEQVVFSKIEKGMVIVPESKKREIALVFDNDKESDKIGSFFEVVDLAKKLGKDNLEKAIIVGFFMEEDRMNIIQSYNLLSSELRLIL